MKKKILIDEKTIQEKIVQLAEKIRSDYRGKELFIVGVLKGAFVLCSDLIRTLNMPVEIEFVRVASYGNRSVSSGEIKWIMDLHSPLVDKNVLLVDDIVDTGYTLKAIYEYLLSLKPLSLRVCVLLDKPARRKVEVPIHYKGFEIPDKFLVGYGLDFNEKFRYLKDIHTLE